MTGIRVFCSSKALRARNGPRGQSSERTHEFQSYDRILIIKLFIVGFPVLQLLSLAVLKLTIRTNGMFSKI